MEIHNLLDVKSRVELREWLIKNHRTEKECWVIVKRGRPTDDTTFWYIDAVEEALCFGWIDSTTKKIAYGVTAQKLCPRKPRSNWSELNKERCRRIERMGLMTDAGRAVLPDMSPDGFNIDKDILQRLQSDPGVWNNFCQFPDLYKRIRIDTIQIKRNNPDLYESRLVKFIENTRKGLLYGEWNDNGRLLKYWTILIHLYFLLLLHYIQKHLAHQLSCHDEHTYRTAHKYNWCHLLGSCWWDRIGGIGTCRDMESSVIQYLHLYRPEKVDLYWWLYFIPVFIYTFIKVKSNWGKKRDGYAIAKWFRPFSLLAAKTYKRPKAKVGPHQPLRSSTKYLTRNPKMSVIPSSILHPILAK